ncbi:ribosome small subunit-dependent GTPase A [Actinomadura parmotrematis]|uniref:Small ribosomal subunit biogenesis GTPase RsgA n=1 Tax=Actinomadura parmotrematis TaxID=2864039 RepID=A0ABS7FSN0_9ACTN|nr:ribosome small subunit-dependent GTPase A [Actinomadura parmotrematis]MBW8482577.1 ribosome small subunit-dependent GTPase A [Actinomadura parmotrematis]
MNHAFPQALVPYGWDAALQQSFLPFTEDGLVPVRVAAVDRGRCDVITPGGPQRAALDPALPTGDPAAAPCTGDWGALRAGDPPVLAALLPRRTAIVRSAASGASRGQVLAANVDTVAIAVSLETRLALGRVERLLALAWESGARPVVVLTKADRSPDPDAAAAQVAEAAPGADVVTVSAATGQGVDVAAAVLTGTVVLLGPSGAGKSTLGNALLGADLLATGAVRDADGKGRHTTVRRELLPLPGGGVLIDTPGLRGVGLFDAAEGVQRAFAEIEELAEGCRFGDCGHDTEPGCAVQAAIAAGALPPRRLDSYRKLVRENERIAARSDARLAAERANRWKTISKAQRQGYRMRGGKDKGR